MTSILDLPPATTPMMQQWSDCKKQAPDAILFFRLGDFYEAFYDDAINASRELDLTLTKRQEIPMCGIPWHTSEGYIERLVLKGFKIAIAEQVEDPKQAKGLVSRKLVRFISPATLVSSSVSSANGHSFFASCVKTKDGYGLSMLDLISASFWVVECKSERELASEIFRMQPKELLVSKRFAKSEFELVQEITKNHKILVSKIDDWLFDPVQSNETLCTHFDVKTLDGFGVKEFTSAVISAGALLQYIRDYQMCTVDHIKRIRPFLPSKTLSLDRQTLVNLEIIESVDKKNSNCSLLSLLDQTKTAMGHRLMKQWVQSPLIQKEKIIERQDAIGDFFQLLEEKPEEAENLVNAFERVKDLEKLIYRIKTKSSSPREYIALKESLAQIPKIKASLATLNAPLIQVINKALNPLTDVVSKIDRELVNEPPLRISDGGLFKRGINCELDELKSLQQNTKEWLINYQTKLRNEMGIKTLKCGYNKMFGYYIEVSKGAASRVPDTLIRRQTLVNAERYISPELKEYEEKILSADEKVFKIEQELFDLLQKYVARFHETILIASQSIARLDVLFSLALIAKKKRYIRPLIDNSRVLEIVEGRHPVIESLSFSEAFTPNDLYLNGDDKALMCLTGPNMAGKSTYIRQTALIVIMAQIGSFVPAKSARVGIVDKVFSRVGASDDLARGHSTFMVEMTETASILHQATDRSLVILDEIGRGTSTYDGISIAWAVAEYLLTMTHGVPKTLFATHYFELTALHKTHRGVVNNTVAISETPNGIVFLRKVIEGIADKSYGVHVARLAGMPESVIRRAKELLTSLEKENITIPEPKKSVEVDLFSQTEKEVLQTIKELSIEKMTPLDALNLLQSLKNKVFI